MSLELINSFVEDYDIDFYNEVAHLAEERCRKSLSDNGIPAIITSRAKRPERLLEKLKQRNEQKNYQTFDDIRKDLVDLSGVRIALYFPNQATQAAQLIEMAFVLDETKIIPSPAPGPPAHAPPSAYPAAPGAPYANQFVGYRAIHLRLHLGSASLPEDKEKYGSSMIEIQIASLLMHAWSEVNHDLAYKTFSGQLSDDELRALDTINGLMLTGEVMLGQLKTMVERRVASQKQPFVTYFELGSFVQKYAPYKAAIEGPTAKYRMGSLSWLLYITKHLEVDNPQALGPILTKWKATGLNEYPVVRSILDYLVNTFNKQRDSDPMASPYFHTKHNELFKKLPEEDRIAQLCRILGYASDGSALADGPGNDISDISFPTSHTLLRDAGLLEIKGAMPVMSGKDLNEVSGAVGDLWKWFAAHEKAQMRVALGIGRARQGNKVTIA